MESFTKLHTRPQPYLSFNLHRSSSPKPLSLLSFTTPFNLLSSSALKFPSIRASTSSSSSPSLHNQSQQKSNSSVLQTLKTISSPLLKATCITIAAAALCVARFNHKPAIAAPQFPTETSSTVESTEYVSVEEQEKKIEEYLVQYPNDIEALRSLMELKIKLKKLPDAIDTVNRLIELEPEELEWELLRAQIYSFDGDFKQAKDGFEEILIKDPLRVEAYHGLVMSYSDSGLDLKDLEKRIKAAMENCKKEKKEKDLRDFKLLLAQMKVVEGNHSEALKLYQDLVNEEPRDFRPYLCQGIIYTLLKKKDEAEKQFEKFRKLVPRNHPYREYFVDNMVATKLFAEKVERE